MFSKRSKDIQQELIDKAQEGVDPGSSSNNGSEDPEQQLFEGGSEWKLRSKVTNGANDAEFLKMIKEKLQDPKDDITKADGILEYYKKLKEPEPLKNLQLIADRFQGMCQMKTDPKKFIA